MLCIVSEGGCTRIPIYIYIHIYISWKYNIYYVCIMSILSCFMRSNTNNDLISHLFSFQTSE